MSKKRASSNHQSRRIQTKIELVDENSLSIQRRLLWALFIGSCLLYGATMRFGFVLDDTAVIENNRFVQEGFGGIPDLFSTFYWKGYWDANAGLYRPLSMVMFAIEWAISPNNPGIHHFVNVLLYATTIGVLFKLFLKLIPNYSVWVSFSIALIFMVHPSHTEVVANIKSRDEILCFLFFLLTFHSLLNQRKEKKSDTIKTVLLFFACLLSKEAGIMYLPIFGLYFLLIGKESLGQVAKKLVPLFVITGAWIVLHQLIIHADPTPPIQYTYHDNSLVACEGGSRFATGIGILGRYIVEVFAPFNLSYDYSYNQLPCLSLTSLPVIGTLIALIISALIVAKTRKSKPEIAFGLLYFFITIALITNIFSLIGTTYANRLVYAPSLGLILVFVIGSFSILKKLGHDKLKNAFWICLLIIATGFSIQTIQRSKVWESNTTLFSADVANSPNSARVHFNYGVLKMNAALVDSTALRKEWLLAVSSFKKALSIDSLDAGACTNLGVVFFRLKDYEQSINYTKRAIELTPNDYSLYSNLGDVYFTISNFTEAVNSLKKGIQSPTFSSTNFKHYGTALFNLKQYQEAISIFEKGLKQFPNDTEMAANLGNAYGAAEKYEEAGRIFETIYNNDPSNTRALQLMILSYEQAGNKDKVSKYREFLK